MKKPLAGLQPLGATSPLRLTENLLGRMAGARMRYGDCGGMLEVEALGATTAATRAEMESLHAEAEAIERADSGLGKVIAEAIADGVVTPSERRQLSRALHLAHTLAGHHMAHTGNLVA